MRITINRNVGGQTCCHCHVYSGAEQVCVMSVDDFNPAIIANMTHEQQAEWAQTGSTPLEIQIRGRIFFGIIDQGLQTVEAVSAYLESVEFVG